MAWGWLRDRESSPRAVTRLSGKPQLCHRSKCASSADIRRDAQLQDGDPGEGDAIVLRLAGCSLRAEIPLLANNLLEGLPAIARPTQHILLRALGSGLQEAQLDPPQLLGARED